MHPRRSLSGYYTLFCLKYNSGWMRESMAFSKSKALLFPTPFEKAM